MEEEQGERVRSEKRWDSPIQQRKEHRLLWKFSLGIEEMSCAFPAIRRERNRKLSIAYLCSLARAAASSATGPVCTVRASMIACV